eukprot:Phypoly_transcript_06311.p1 GENE.Phypoly_transcript_06311~~Phypoly_transcript_06311.p1  ORF type:complete len:394 (+),score=78.34 Phypoly_transcript_06311:130-1311(+)
MCYMTTTLIQPLQPAGSSAHLNYFNTSSKVMALDTIKPPKNNKPFPFSPPTITKHNSPTTGALILEIIFSPDDVSPGGNNMQGQEEMEEEDNSGDSDEEDDVGNHDTRSHIDSSEGDSDEDEEEDDDEEEDEDEEDEDGAESDEDQEDDGDLDDEDFGNDFDKDLIIDFGTEENEDDQLVIEFEDAAITSPPHSPPKASPEQSANKVPFWFTHEEPDQIRMIFESYAVTLNLEEQRKACVRAPAPFIGRIRRTPVKPLESETETCFKTLDKVEIFLRELYPLGTMLPLSRVTWVLTTWDLNDGVPIQSQELQKSSKIVSPLTFTIESIQRRTHGQSSTLYCAPIERTKEEYQYSVSPQDHNLMYASNSSTNACIKTISPFLPEHCRVISFSLD